MLNKRNKKGIETEMLIRILILIGLFAIIGFAINYLLRKYGVI